MNDCKVEGRQTLIQAFERLDERCAQLQEVAGMTERVVDKLNRTEGDPKEKEALNEKKGNVPRNMVDLFNSLSDKIETQIGRIGNSAEAAMGMID
jgi:hypothetical protein